MFINMITCSTGHYNELQRTAIKLQNNLVLQSNLKKWNPDHYNNYWYGWRMNNFDRCCIGSLLIKSDQLHSQVLLYTWLVQSLTLLSFICFYFLLYQFRITHGLVIKCRVPTIFPTQLPGLLYVIRSNKIVHLVSIDSNIIRLHCVYKRSCLWLI